MDPAQRSGPNLFISYASVDRPRVLPRVDALGDRQFTCWIDLQGITPGESYGPEIVDGISRADAVLLMCSDASLASRNVRQEIQLAWKYDRPIIPILLDQIHIPDDLAYWLEGAQWIDTTVLNADEWIDRVQGALFKRGIVAAPTLAVQCAPEPHSPGTGNLPRDRGTLIGRDRERQRLVALVANSRLVTITGPGGVGKTTLALDAASRLTQNLRDGAWFVDASATNTVDQLIAEIALALGVQTTPLISVADSVADHVRGRQLLLLLDNLEQNPGAGAVISSLLEASDDVSVVATSRTPLRVAREASFPLAGFDLSRSADQTSAAALASTPAVALFVERAKAVRPEFVLTDGNAGTIAEICSRLDGLPLAIELAASRSRVLPPASILERLGSVLDLAQRSGSVRSDRQSTLRSTIRWSYDLLEPEEQSAFRQLSICDGGFSIEAAEGICSSAETVDHLDVLLDHHLIVDDGAHASNGSPRFRMLETVRTFARETLDLDPEAEAVKVRHLAWFRDEVRRARANIDAGSDPDIFQSLAADHANLRRAFTTALENGDVDVAADMAVDLMKYWIARGQLNEGALIATSCLSAPASLPDVQQARLLQTRAVLLETSGDLPGALADWRSAVERATTADDELLLASALGGLGTASEASGDYTAATDAYLRALELHRAAGNKRGEATTLHYLGSLETMRGNYVEADRHCTEAARIWRSLGEVLPLAYSIQQSGILAFLAGDYDLAITRYEETLGLVETVGDQYGIGNALINLGSALEMDGRYDESIARLNQARAILAEMGDEGGVGYAEYLLGHVGRATRDPLASVTLSGALSRLSAVGDLASMALVHETLAGLAIDRRDKSEAAHHFAEAERLRAETGAAVPGSRIQEVERDRNALAQL